MKGEITFDFGGKSYRMKLGHGAIARAQREMGTFDMSNPGPDHMVSMFWAGLNRYHKGITWDAAADLMDDMGSEAAGEVLGRAMLAGGWTSADAPAEEAEASAPQMAAE